MSVARYQHGAFDKLSFGYANLKRTKVNTYGLVYEWDGAKDGKPLLLAAHTDVVPVNPETYDDWINPPYSGYYEGDGSGAGEAVMGLSEGCESGLQAPFLCDGLMATLKNCDWNTTEAWIRTVSHGLVSLWYR